MRSRTSIFNIVPPDNSSPFTFPVPDAAVAKVKQRLRDNLPELLEPLGHSDGPGLAYEIVRWPAATLPPTAVLR